MKKEMLQFNYKKNTTLLQKCNIPVIDLVIN